MYSGLSIGPIYETISNAKKTREIWLSSYIFSYLMKEIIKELLNNINEDDFITPYINKADEDFFKDSSVGRFHDRLIYKGKRQYLDEAIKIVLSKLAKVISKDLKVNQEDVNQFLNSYFNFFIVELNTNSIDEVNKFLNSKEMFYKIVNFDTNYLLKWIALPKNKNYFYNNYVEQFKSLPEIAISEKIENSEDEQKDFQRVIKKLDKEKRLKPYHKYVAIVNADGDNLSKALKKENIKTISKKLFEFSNKAVETIDKYGGNVIYAGGDDLLFFAPVKTDEMDIFELIEEITSKYNITSSTLSFGISISFYKFPLNEALNISRNLLYEAKNSGKNRIAFQVIKHSGQTFDLVVKKDDRFKEFIKFLKFDEDSEFLHSLYSKIYYYEKLLETIKDDKTNLDNFFKNFFNENYSKYEKFLKEVSNMIYLYKEESIKFVYSIIRYMKFLKGDK